MSPHASDFGGDMMSPITSPPATPSQVQDSEHQHNSDTHRSSALQNAFRRRTTPTLRLGKDDTSTSVNEDENEVLFLFVHVKCMHEYNSSGDRCVFQIRKYIKCL